MTAVVIKPEWATSTRNDGEQVVHERQMVVIESSFDGWSQTGHERAIVQIERWDRLDLDDQTCKVGAVEVYVEIPSGSFNVTELRRLSDALSEAADLAEQQRRQRPK